MVLTACPPRCSTCSGRGNKTCATCKGEKKLLHFIQLVIMWYVAVSQCGGPAGGRGLEWFLQRNSVVGTCGEGETPGKGQHGRREAGGLETDPSSHLLSPRSGAAATPHLGSPCVLNAQGGAGRLPSRQGFSCWGSAQCSGGGWREGHSTELSVRHRFPVPS